MATTNAEPVSGIDPNRLYTYAELAAVTGLSKRKIRREVEEFRRLGYVQTSPERGRMVRGSQYLVWLDRLEVEPEEVR